MDSRCLLIRPDFGAWWLLSRDTDGSDMSVPPLRVQAICIVLSQGGAEVEDHQGLRVFLGGTELLMCLFRDWIISLFIEWILMCAGDHGRSTCRDTFTEAKAAALVTQEVEVE